MIDLTPNITCYTNGNVDIKFSDYFYKLFSSEIDYVDVIKNYYFEEPNHCKNFIFKNIYKFDEELEKIKEIFKLLPLNKETRENFKMKVEELCYKFLNSQEFIANSIDYHNKWTEEKFK